MNSTINPGGNYTIPAGYHNGSGKVTASSSGTGVVLTVSPSTSEDSSNWYGNYNISSYANFRNININNIYFEPNGYVSASSWGTYGSECNISKSYNASTGVLTVKTTITRPDRGVTRFSSAKIIIIA